MPADCTRPGRGRAGRRAGDRPLRPDRHVRRERDRHGVRGDLPLRARRAAPDHGRQLLRPGVRLLGGAAAPARVAGHVRAVQLGARLPRHPAPGRLLRVEGGAAATSSSRPASSSRKARLGRRRLGRPPGGDQHAAVRPRPAEDRQAAAAGAADLPAGAVRGGGLHCCEHPIRELPVGWGAQKLMWGQKLSPRAGDLCCCGSGWKGQHTDEDKPLDSPDNLFETLPGDPGAHGRFDAHRAADALDVARLRRCSWAPRSRRRRRIRRAARHRGLTRD